MNVSLFRAPGALACSCLLLVTAAALRSQATDRAQVQAGLEAAGKLSVLGEPIRRHAGPAVDLDIADDGSLAVSAGADHTAIVWLLEKTGRARRTLRGHEGPLFFARFCAGDTRVVTSAADRTLRVWDAATAEEVAKVETECGWSVGAVSADGALLALGSPDAEVVEVRSLPKLEVLAEVPVSEEGAVALAWSGDGRYLVTGAYGHVQVWDQKRKKVSGSIDPGEDIDSSVTSLAVSEDGARLAIGGDDVLSVWSFPDLGDESQMTSSGFDGELRGITWAGGGKIVFADGTGLICMNVDNEETLWSKYEHRDAIAGVDVCVGQLLCGTASQDQNVRFWGLRTPKERFAISGNRDMVRAVAWSPDGHHIVAGDYGNVTTIHDVRTKKIVVSREPHTNSIVAATFRGKAFEVVGADHLLVRLNTDGSLASDSFEILGLDAALTGIAFGGSRFATVWDDGAVQLHDWDGGVLDRIRAHSGGAASVVRLASGKFASSGYDGVVRIWKTKGEDLEEHAVIDGFDGAPDLAASGDRVVGVMIGEVAVWSAEGEELLRFALPEDDDVQCYCASQSHLVTGHGSSIRFWSLQDGTIGQELTGFASVPVCLAIHPHGAGIAAGMVDGTVVVFHGQ